MQAEPLDVLVAELRVDPATCTVPVVVLGPDDEDRTVAMLTAGADVYLAWPTPSRLFVARIRALLRRVYHTYPRATRRSHGVYTFYTGADQVCLNGERISLTRMEYRAAMLLFARISRLVTYTDLWMAMWEGISRMEPQRRTVCVHMSRLRSKLRLTGECGYQLISVRGSGYQLVPSVSGFEREMMSQVVNF
ncbi:response regulator transcription factor [Burkholderia pyrrocinia]|uniref:response regulator transcription factor n=1 Tax=Burkholderia pyrrocinia TaxID=60550 RepID=UPI001BCC95BC|nr:response regulator transcription factor [Burkholderia pyrrocinia]QVN21306.1 response regulator transcription factor [Burkholderia pyrrocinia]